jgi:hypothetical protein
VKRKRKLIGIVKVHAIVEDGCTTYEAVWPVELYEKVHNCHAGNRTRVVQASKANNAPPLRPWGAA